MRSNMGHDPGPSQAAGKQSLKGTTSSCPWEGLSFTHHSSLPPFRKLKRERVQSTLTFLYLYSSSPSLYTSEFPEGQVDLNFNYHILPCIMRTHSLARPMYNAHPSCCPCIMHILIFPSKIWAKQCTLYTAKYGN